MSVRVPLEVFTALDKSKRLGVTRDLTVTSSTTGEEVEAFSLEFQQAFFPMYYLREQHADVCTTGDYHTLTTTHTTFQLRDYQKAVEAEVDEVISSFQSVLLSLHCGWGKSYFAILYALKLGLQTLVTVYRVSHLEQWKDSIAAVNADLKVQVLQSKTKMKPGMDFYLILGENLAHRFHTEFDTVGTFIVDECHQFCTPSMSKAFFRVQPKYCFGLSATPFRTDRMDRLLQLHFGYSIIRRKLYRPFNVYKLATGFKPHVQTTPMGELDWSEVLNSQAMNAKRNDLIVRLCQFFRNRTIMILCKRVELHGELLLKLFRAAGESVDMFAGATQTYNKDARILIATYSKAGVGFDNPKLDMLIVAGDVEEMFEQYMGRVFRRTDTVPIIVDIVDKFATFEKHFCTRMLTYLSSGGEVKSFQEHFPEVDI